MKPKNLLQHLFMFEERAIYEGLGATLISDDFDIKQAHKTLKRKQIILWNFRTEVGSKRIRFSPILIILN
jgi:hypothetical protein